MENQLEDDLRRVLRLARLEARTRRGKTPKRPAGSNVPSKHSEPSTREHRHRHDRELASRARPTLLHAKLQGLSAVYGLERNSRHLADCSHKSVLLHREPEGHEVDTALQRRLEARQARYRQHFSGALAATGGRSRQLEDLLEAAARKARGSRAVGVGIGAAVLTDSQLIFAAGAVENGPLSLCAERAAVFQMLTSTSSCRPEETTSCRHTVAALAICSEQRELLPFPCGGCRELLAECGDFPVYLVNALGESEETRSSTLFPRARHSELTHRMTQTTASLAQVQPRPRTSSTPDRASIEIPLEVKHWTPEHVVQWLEQSVELPQYRDVFERHAVDGCTLVLLEASDLTLLLGVTQPLHRAKLLAHIDRLRDRELLVRGLDYTQLEDYLAVLDADRVSAVAQLKATFDRLDADRDGFLDFTQLRTALASLRCAIPPALQPDDVSSLDESSGTNAVDASAQAVERLLHSEALFGAEAARTGKVAFPAFARAFSKLALQSADSASVTRGAFAQHALGPRLPVLDLPHLREDFERHAANDGVNAKQKVDEPALARLLQSLGQAEPRSTEIAHEWLAASSDGRGPRESLDFARFVVRYVELMETAVDCDAEATAPSTMARLQQLFQTFEPVRSTRWKPRAVLLRALTTLFPAALKDEVGVWCASYWSSRSKTAQATQVDSRDVATRQRKALSFPEFALACLLFAAEMHKLEQQAAELKLALRNDALAHRSRVVHLHQSGHVRLCPQPREEVGKRSAQRSVTESKAKTEVKQTHCRRLGRRNQRAGASDEDGGKHDDEERKTSDSEDEEDAIRRPRRPQDRREQQVNEAFARFARRPEKQRRADHNEGKHDSEDEDADEAAGVLNAVEAAQAALELGAALSREQVLRFLEREGLGSLCKREISRRAFQRLMTRLDANQVKPRDLRELANVSVAGCQPGSSEHGRNPRIDSQSPRRRAYCSRQDYDDFLRQQHAKRTGSRWQDEVETLRREKQRKEERRKRQTRRRPRRETRDSDGDGKHDSSSEDDARPRRARRPASRPRQGRAHSRNRHRSRSRARLARPRRPSFFSSSTDTESSSTESSSSSSCALGLHGGFRPGTRVASMVHGRGTLERVYAEFFVADVHFDSGRRVRNVELGGLRVLDPEADQVAWPPTSSFKVGSLVSVAHRGTKSRRRGKIVACRTDGSFDVLLDEFGEAQTLRRLARHELDAYTSLRAKPTIYRDGAGVTVRQRTEYLRGRVCLCRPDGSYDVKLLRPPHKVLTRLATELLAPDDVVDTEEDEQDERDEDAKPKEASSRAETSRKPDPDDDSFEPEFTRGDRVEARFGGQGVYYPGTIERVHVDGSCAISYDDGDEEERVAPRLIRVLAARAAPEVRGHAASKPTKGKTAADSDDYEEDLFESD